MRLLSLLVLLVLPSIVFAQPPSDAAKHWSFQPPSKPTPPQFTEASHKSWVKNPVDAFILDRLLRAGLSPASPADRTTVIRRVTFDLTGLPPTPAEIDAFLKDESPQGYEKLIDRLLASPRYCERWARHWLDLARYADTNGFEFDEPRPDAWRYRDYVIRSFNADKPYDRFVVEQLAGDEAYPGDRDALIATGFNLLGPDMTDSADQLQRRHNTLNDMTDTAGLVFLGMTITCARCHDHKFEPIPQVDYYRLQAFFMPAAFRRDLSVATSSEMATRRAAQREYDEATKDIFARIAMIELPHRTKLYEAKLARLSTEAQAAHRTPPDRRTGGQQELVAETARLLGLSDAEIARQLSDEDKARLRKLKSSLASFDGKKPAPPSIATGLADQPGPPAKTFVLERGEVINRGDEVKPGFPSVLSDRKPAVISSVPNSTGRRLALAKWVANKENPLTARVIANRLWQHHFGKGLVATPSDFGLRGERPTHPELLDWLANDFVEHGWSLKHLHRVLLLSSAYRQSSQVSGAALAKDRDNKLLSRMNRMRLEGEAVRDALLFVSGRLNEKAGGPGVVLPEGSTAAGGSRPVPITADPMEYNRRSIYLFARRNLRLPFLEAFDLPDSNLSCPKREKSTTAPQALSLLNAPEVLAAAKALSDRVTREAATEAARIELAYRLALGRAPTDKERQRAAAFLKDSPLSELCRALFNLNEFVYLE
jgi:hypothetical protein